MKFITVAQLFERLESINSRNEITHLLAQLLKEATPTESAIIGNLSLGQLNPPYRNTQFNIATALITKTLAALLQCTHDHIEKEAKKLGDFGLVIQQEAKSGHLAKHTG